jgi:two-component system, NtrC family, sensor kinase
VVQGQQATRAPVAIVPPASALIWIDTRQVGDQVVIRIGNTGHPIPEAIQNHLFDPFFTTKAVGKGTGLGLAISYQIVVERHRGQLFHQNVDHGVEFVVQIPLRQST